LHPLVGSRQGRLQDRRFGASGSSLGPAQEPSRHELRQAVALNPTVLQEGYHEKNRTEPTFGLPVLSSLLLVSNICMQGGLNSAAGLRVKLQGCGKANSLPLCLWRVTGWPGNLICYFYYLLLFSFILFSWNFISSFDFFCP